MFLKRLKGQTLLKGGYRGGEDALTKARATNGFPPEVGQRLRDFIGDDDLHEWGPNLIHLCKCDRKAFSESMDELKVRLDMVGAGTRKKLDSNGAWLTDTFHRRTKGKWKKVKPPSPKVNWNSKTKEFTPADT